RMGADRGIRPHVPPRIHEEARRDRSASDSTSGEGVVSYFVDWKDDALDSLSAAWVDIADKASVNDAELEITRLLARDPLAVGVPVSEGLRRLELFPLAASYYVDIPYRLVDEYQIAYFIGSSPYSIMTTNLVLV